MLTYLSIYLVSGRVTVLLSTAVFFLVLIVAQTRWYCPSLLVSCSCYLCGCVV